jgi:DNA-binding MarR family transcriptional regulator
MKARKSETLTRLILEIFRVNGRLLSAGDKLVEPFGQTSSRWQVLGAIEEAPASVPMIGRVMGISRQSVQRTANLLIEDGLCEMIENPHHQKSLLLKLTKQGVGVVAKMGKVQTRWVSRLASHFGESDIETTLRVVSALVGELERDE